MHQNWLEQLRELLSHAISSRGQGVINSLSTVVLGPLTQPAAQLQSNFPPQWNDPAKQRRRSFEQDSVVQWVEQLPGMHGVDWSAADQSH